MTLGERISKAITASQTDVKDVAKACDISAQAVYAWMRDEIKDLRNANLFELARLTGFNAEWIATGNGPEVSNYKNARIQHVLQVMESMPDVVLDEAVKEIDSLAEFAHRLQRGDNANGTHG
jgi:transcriptional regulator with XRE-family HTH domain